jgi:ferredoxin-NADP reductase
MSQYAQMVGLGIGWLLVAWVGLGGLRFGWLALRRRRHWRQECEHRRIELRRRVQAAARAARAAKAIGDWSGWRAFRVAAIVDEASDVKSFYFAPADGRPLAPFAPGQYLTFRLPLAGSAAPLIRCYSLSDRPRQDYYRTTIKRLRPPAGRPELQPGRGSSFFHEQLRVGDVLEARAPAGTFLIDPWASDPVVLLGAGIGITPLMSMLESIAEAGRLREMYALFGFRNGEEHPFQQRLERLAETDPKLHVHVSYSAPRDGDVLYRDYEHRGRLTIDRVRAVLPSNNFRFYVCGPPSLMESLVPALWEWGVPESHVHFEAFGPASVQSIRASRAEDAERRCEVRFARSDRSLTWEETAASLLDFGEAAGIAMPSGCRAGSCGECMTAVRSGRVRMLKVPGITVPSGYCLACISRPDGDLILEA